MKVLNRVGLFSERVAGLPPWAALPLGVLSGSLLIAVFGMYLTVLLIGVALYASMGRDLALLRRRLGAAAARA